MITPAYVREMSRYNAWQNKQIAGFIEVMDQEALTLDRGAFCGSILGTLNHLLWCDAIWMHRWSALSEPPVAIETVEDTFAVTNTGAEWWAARAPLDAKIKSWADAMDAQTLAGDLTWFSGVQQQNLTEPLAGCVLHFFNHQTHHRGQVHALLTAAGSKAPVSDLVFMPEDA